MIAVKSVKSESKETSQGRNSVKYDKYSPYKDFYLQLVKIYSNLFCEQWNRKTFVLNMTLFHAENEKSHKK